MAITFPWASVLKSVRTAIRGKDVRENLAQMGEYCKQYAEEAGTRADNAKEAAASSATQAGRSETAAAGSAAAASQSAQDAAKIAADTASSTLSALGLTVVDGKICAVYRRSGT